MKIAKAIVCLLGVALLLSACAGGGPATPTSVPATPSASGTKFQGMPSATVDAIYKEVQTALGVAEMKIAQEGFTLTLGSNTAIVKAGLEILPTTSWGQVIIAGGTGVNFSSASDTTQKMAAVLKGLGWTEDMAFAADGPMGSVRGFRKDKAIAVIEVNWVPASDVQVDPNQPIEAQNIPANKQLYTVRLLLAVQPF